MLRFMVATAAATIAAVVAAEAPVSARANIFMNNDAFVYSPFNWALISNDEPLSPAQSGTAVPTMPTAKTINAGAYFRIIFSGQTALLWVEPPPAGSPGPYSQFWTRVDGGPLQPHVLAPGVASFPVALGPPFSASDFHLLEVIVKSTSETIDRWNQQTTAVAFKSLEIDANATVQRPARKPKTVLIYGDSITEGVRTLGYQGIANDTDRNDAVRDYSYQLSQTLPCEVGVVAFGATGLTKGGSGNVPALPESFDKLWAGQPRDFAHTIPDVGTPTPPDLVIYNEGTNDSPDVTKAFISVVHGVFAATPATTKQLLLVPFDGQHAAQIRGVVQHFAGGNTSGRVLFGDTAGFYDGVDGLHPFGYNHVGNIAPKMAALVAPLLL